MKKILLLTAVVFSFAACKSKDKNGSGSIAESTTSKTDANGQPIADDPATLTTIQWIDSINTNLGTLVKDQSIEVSFRFKNSGDKNLIIKDVSASCGCTIPEKPQKPFAPGEEGVIRAKFNGSGSGHISKHIFVKANTKPQTDYTLTFEGDMKE
ncbi:MAG: hypothetical protein BWZ05_01799 [Bacteroidetes bacterium ADurb.BinA245]|jgi:hypothetical protein|nr:DUF1573 domain-containing protein [Chitinophagaceae bacterium]OPZ16658.1 MAG: hypothetical protein BWZ05_01799 [Bacteroidetes bacterium ADurb.BinA245]